MEQKVSFENVKEEFLEVENVTDSESLQIPFISDINFVIKKEDPEFTEFNLQDTNLHRSTDIDWESQPGSECVDDKSLVAKILPFACEISNINFIVKKEDPECAQFNLEGKDLHHSVDIKDESILLNCGEDIPHRTNHNLPFACEICDYKTLIKRNLTRHLRTHNGKKPLSCEICGLQCTVQQDLKRHVLIAHSGEKPFSCQFCDYKGAKKRELKVHVMRIHIREKPFACEVCNYAGTFKQDLKRHSKIHSGEKPFACDSCDYKSLTKQNFIRHLKTHPSEDSIACEICVYKCSNKDCSKQHVMTHPRKQSFECEVCSDKFICKQALKLHVMRIHYADKQNVCSFSNNEYLSMHIDEKPFACELNIKKEDL